MVSFHSFFVCLPGRVSSEPPCPLWTKGTLKPFASDSTCEATCWRSQKRKTMYSIWLVVDLPLWKIWQSMGRMTSHILWKIKNVPNHQSGIILDYMNIIQYTCSYIHCTYALVSWLVPGLVAFNPTWSRNTYQQKWLHMCGCDKSHVKKKVEWHWVTANLVHLYIYICICIFSKSDESIWVMFGEDGLIQQLQPAGSCKPWGQTGSRFNLAPVTCDLDGDRWNFDLESTAS